MVHRFSIPTLLVTAAVVLGTLAACSSSTGSGGGDSPPSSEAGFCDTLSSAYARCGGGTSCATSITADCTKLASVLSPSVLDASKTCITNAPCGTDPLSCLGQSLGSVTTTDAQTKLATDYCTSCSVVGGSACETVFFGTASVPGLAFVLLPFGDGPLDAIDTSCTSSSFGKTACQTGFTTCLSAATTKFLATTLSAGSAKCLLDGIESGLAGTLDGGGGNGDGGSTTDASPPACGPDTCAGCCGADGVCHTADENASCGRGGAACTACGGAQTCESGQCIDPGCKATCASGCCSSAGCQLGNAANACGTGGNACSTCGGGQACSGGTCALSGGALFDFVLLFADVPATDLAGDSWDGFGGLPDPFAKVMSGAAAGTSDTENDTLTPVWNANLVPGLTAAALKANLDVQVYDSDVAFDDLMGGCAVGLSDGDFDGALHAKACPASATGVALTLHYRLVAH